MNRIAVCGLPGRMAHAVAEAAHESADCEVLGHSLTGPGMDSSMRVGGREVLLYAPNRRAAFLEALRKEGPAIVIDYTHPDSVVDNARFYVENHLPFVMGTTGGDRGVLAKLVAEKNHPAVIAPNMALPIVAITAMLEWGSKNFPGVFRSYQLKVKESHQIGKADTSGTARALIALFQTLGAEYQEENLELCRDPEAQRAEWGIPEEHLAGHAYHTYSLDNAAYGANFRLDHNILGRRIYAEGTLEAVRFLASRINEGGAKKARAMPYTMIDVLQHLETDRV